MNVLNILYIRRKFIWILLFCSALSGASVCQVNRNVTDSDSHTTGVSISQGNDFITCPGPHDPTNHTACCYTSEDDPEDGNEEDTEGSQDGPRCCVPPLQPVGIFYIDDQLAMIIALSVTTVCVIITIIIIICCFWSRCPLYSACRIRYHQDDIIAYASKDEETAGLNDMPPEETKGVSIYSPNAVKVTLKNDV